MQMQNFANCLTLTLTQVTHVIAAMGLLQHIVQGESRCIVNHSFFKSTTLTKLVLFTHFSPVPTELNRRSRRDRELYNGPKGDQRDSRLETYQKSK